MALTRRRAERPALTTYEVASPRVPACFDGFRILQVSDLHQKRFGPRHRRLVEAAGRCRPELIAVTGDLTLRREWEGEYVADLARQLSQMAPVYFVCGNHEAACRDLPALLQALADNGVRVLHPSGREALVRPGGSIRVAGTGGSIMMAGIADPRFHAREPAQWGANLAGLRGGVDGDPYTVLLSHRPERFAEYTQAGFDLVLAGHAHGGQIRLPGIGGLYAPDQGFLPRYSCGCSQAGRTAMVVSRGLGDSGPFLRLFNPPELVMVRLVALDAGQPPWAAIPRTFAVHPGRG